MPAVLRALRGATTLEEDTAEQIGERVPVLVATMFPATAARSLGLGDVPLICARELAIAGATARCVRVLMHFYTERSRGELHHVYLEGARGLRDDLPG